MPNVAHWAALGCLALSFGSMQARADITVGVIVALTGPNSALGVP